MVYEPEGSMQNSQELSNNPYLKPNQPNTYFFNIYSTPRPSLRSPRVDLPIKNNPVEPEGSMPHS
jgi:hypothetical protein